MSNSLTQALEQASDLTFEQLAFMMPMPGEFADEVDDSPGGCAIVEFSGPFAGAVGLSLSGGVMAELAVNMLGLEPGQTPEPAMQLDAMKELSNVICGNLLPVLAGDEAVFNVHAPQTVETGHLPETWQDHPISAQLEVALDTGKATLCLFVDENANALAG